MSSGSLRIYFKIMMTQFLTQQMPLVERVIQSLPVMSDFHALGTDNLLNFECDYFLGFFRIKIKIFMILSILFLYFLCF